MLGIDFKNRFKASLPEMPSGIDIGEFIDFSSYQLEALDIVDAGLLADAGFPRDASPFLSFSAYSENEIKDMSSIGVLPQGSIPIGLNGSGDIIAIEAQTNNVVYYNHDAENQGVFINSTLIAFAECLCVYQEHLNGNNMGSCLSAIGKVDQESVVKGGMWFDEVNNELENG